MKYKNPGKMFAVALMFCFLLFGLISTVASSTLTENQGTIIIFVAGILSAVSYTLLLRRNLK